MKIVKVTLYLLFLLIAISSLAFFFHSPAQTQKQEPQVTTPLPSLPTPPQPDQIHSPTKTGTVPAATAKLVRSVRVDLSSILDKANPDLLASEILKHLIASGANTVFLSPWSDGLANYRSVIVAQNHFGESSFFENFIREAHRNHIAVYAWFVVGKDNFPSDLHPEWFARTIEDQNYFQEDEPGVNLPFASLANDDYLAYHLSLIKEVDSLPIDGWVISEPLIGWGDDSDPTYTDFSLAALTKFKATYGTSLKPPFPRPFHLSPVYENWISFRASLVTNFVKSTMETIRTDNAIRPVVITLFTEPNQSGKLKNFSEIKEWLGLDIPALLTLRPDFFEIQDLFMDFEFSQPASWTSSFIRQFRAQLSSTIPLLISIQGFPTNRKLPTVQEFKTAIQTALEEKVSGVSFYAYHTLSKQLWKTLKETW